MVEIYSNHESLSHAAAKLFVSLAQTAVSQHGRFLAALSGGGTPEGMYRLLARPPYAQQMPWQHTEIFWSDERLVSPDDEESNYHQAYTLLLQHVPIPQTNIYRAKGELDAPDAVADYLNLLQRAGNGQTWPRFDLILLGLGSDGHTASLFPGDTAALEAKTPVTAVSADYNGRPAKRITFTPLLINRARHVLFLVSGENKAAALAAVQQKEENPIRRPALAVQPNAGVVHWLADAAAAARL